MSLYAIYISLGTAELISFMSCAYDQGAKNHGVVMPDANKENTLNQLAGAAFGAAGQRCMALSTALLVGEARNWLPELVERAKNLHVNAGTQMLDLFRPKAVMFSKDVVGM